MYTAAEVNLIEDPMADYAPIKIDGDSITVTIGHHEIMTIKFKR